MARKSKGRQKLEMVKMEKQSNLQVTFSKRRAGLFKKASELSTLCGAEVLVVVFSPGHKVYSFGHPSVETIINRFFTGNPPQNSGAMQIFEAHRNVNIGQLNMQLMQLTSEIEVEKNKNDMLKNIMMARQSENWWEKPVEELNLDQLGEMKDALEQLKNKVTLEAEKAMMMQNANQQTFYGANSSQSQGPPIHGGMFTNYNSNAMPHATTYPPYNPSYGHGGGFY